ncbi:DUF2793 domain-containing protein [Gemmobacter fulva]|uniref:DUF2793 domain-containing protein n=1 Tax=Gemmobacter fulvus TaxID=2840474 RepID=UPI001FEC67D6|nr:DUF2793 domain-containing protein [Gemmobacter fulvus]
MPDDVSAVLNLPYIQPSQAQKHVTHNEALRLLDVLVQLVVTDRSLTVPPAAPGAGARYIVAAEAGGPWAGQEGAIALHEAGGWQFFAPQPGWSAHVLAEAVTVVFDGVHWRAPVEEPQLFSELGINTSADATNRVAVAAAATLFSHVGDGHQMKINKAGPGATASLLFQSGWSGRAELGLVGSNDFSVKVSADGGSFAEALRAEAETGRVLAPQGLLVAQGSAGAPGLGFAGDADTGLCRPAADQIGFATGGIQRALLSASALSLSVPLAGTAVTQGTTDTTAGRLLKTGDFGLGVPIPLGSADNLDTLGSGLFLFQFHSQQYIGQQLPGFLGGGAAQSAALADQLDTDLLHLCRRGPWSDVLSFAGGGRLVALERDVPFGPFVGHGEPERGPAHRRGDGARQQCQWRVCALCRWHADLHPDPVRGDLGADQLGLSRGLRGGAAAVGGGAGQCAVLSGAGCRPGCQARASPCATRPMRCAPMWRG